MRFLLIVYFIVSFSRKSYQKCELSGSRLLCDDVKFSTVLDTYRGRNEINHMELKNCDKQQVRRNEIRLERLETLRLSCNTQRIYPGAFNNLKSLKTLDLSNNYLEELPKNIFDVLTNLKTLNLAQNNIGVISNDQLNGLINLDYLILSSNNISDLQQGTFSSVYNLRRLDLSSNYLEELKPMVFNGVGVLDVLNLSYNAIKEISGDAFKYVSVATLDLSNNNIETLIDSNNNSFLTTDQSLSHLKTLNLSHNRLRQFDSGIFSNLYYLENLILSHNLNSWIRGGSYDGLQNLLFLDLSNNNENSIEKTAFASLKKLQRLDLSHNQIDWIENTTFVGLDNLNYLDLADNKNLFYIEKGTFDPLTNLITLNYSMNNFRKQFDNDFHFSQKFHNFIDDFFGADMRIETLDLSHNEIVKIKRIFWYTKELKYLNVSHNNLTYLSGDTFGDLKLETVDISFNKLTIVEGGLLNLAYVKNVYLSNNWIEELNLNVGPYKNKLEVLDVRSNRINYLDVPSFRFSPKLRRVEIVGNPLDCKCFLNLMKYFSVNFVKYDIDNEFVRGARPVCSVKGDQKDRCG